MRFLSGSLLLVLLVLCAGPQHAVSFAPCASNNVAIGSTCPAECGNAYDQCGGSNFSGRTCCKPGLTCSVVSATYSQCKPENPPTPATCVAPFKQCGGTGYTGPNCCTTGYLCEQQIIENQFYSQCIASPESGCPCAGDQGYCKRNGSKRTCTACAGITVGLETLECCPRGAAGYTPAQGATGGNGPMWQLSSALGASGRTFLICNWKTLTPNAKWANSIAACPNDENPDSGFAPQRLSQLKSAPYVGFRFCPISNGYLHATTLNLDSDKDPMLAIEREADNKCIIYDDDTQTLSATVGVAVVKGQCYIVHLTSFRTEVPSGVKVWFDQTPPVAARARSTEPPEKTF